MLSSSYLILLSAAMITAELLLDAVCYNGCPVIKNNNNNKTAHAYMLSRCTQHICLCLCLLLLSLICLSVFLSLGKIIPFLRGGGGGDSL